VIFRYNEFQIQVHKNVDGITAKAYNGNTLVFNHTFKMDKSEEEVAKEVYAILKSGGHITSN